jgi:hypothetical protein
MRLVAMPKLIQRWQYYGWIQVVRRMGPGFRDLVSLARRLKLKFRLAMIHWISIETKT